MRTPWFIGDEASASAWRLAGVHTVVPNPGEEPQCFRAAQMEKPPLLLVTSSVAASLPGVMLEAALVGMQPLVLVIPNSLQPDAAPDLAAIIRSRLGLTS